MGVDLDGQQAQRERVLGDAPGLLGRGQALQRARGPRQRLQAAHARAEQRAARSLPRGRARKVVITCSDSRYCCPKNLQNPKTLKTPAACPGAGPATHVKPPFQPQWMLPSVCRLSRRQCPRCNGTPLFPTPSSSGR